MRTWLEAVALGLVVALTAPVEAATGGKGRSDWALVLKLERRAGITVRLRDGETITGRLADAEADHLSIRIRRVVRTLARPDIRSVRRAGRSPLRKLAGLVFGAAAGAVIGAISGASLTQCECEYPGLAGAILGFLIGAVTGAVSGVVLAAKGEGALVYESLDPP
jgi:hypothetical protein